MPEVTTPANRRFSHPCVAVALCCLAGAICGQSLAQDSGSPGDRHSLSSESIKGVQVPPAPDPAQNMSIAGADTNANGIRDDVERLIALRYSAANIPHVLELARSRQTFLTMDAADPAKLTEQAAKMMRLMVCLPSAVKLEDPEVSTLVNLALLDNPDRIRAYSERLRMAGNISIPSGIAACGGGE